MSVQAITEGAEIDERIAVSQIECPAAVGGQGRLFQGQQQVAKAAFAGTVGAKNDREGGQAKAAGVFPGLEILDVERGQHGVTPVMKRHGPTGPRRRGPGVGCGIRRTGGVRCF